ncbi:MULTISPECIES: ABC transporter permease [Bacillaceae]|uniref:ABC transporter permease n=1 Tax=Evansella alkalicola TaxID=745819 RepID=A0ABS6JT52_9BACI|nr:MULTISPECIES: ABC transporter permease subunit [Bacillaceae]MBU9721753.1 ABC transporter permease [Bacillus alkalicola]
MRLWLILFKKEFKESLRNFKWLWIPLVLILLGIMQPVTSYFLPDILESFGDLPEGAILNFPVPTAAQVLAETIGQFNQIGVLIIVLAFMGIITGERNKGTNVMVLVKPVPFSTYITTKWVHMSLLMISAFLLGFLIALYYTFELIGTVPMSHVFKGMLVYCLWLLFITSILLLFSVLFNSTAAVAALTLGTTITLSLLSSLTPKLMAWSPGMLVSHTFRFFETGSAGDGFWLAAIITAVIIFISLVASTYIFKNKEVVSHTT